MPEGSLSVLTVGRLAPVKGQVLLVRAIATLASRGIDAGAVMAGDGPMRGQLEREAVQLGVEDRVKLLGAVAQDRVPCLYSGADVFCLPSFAEGLPVVLMEAMSSCLPVVSTRVAGVGELVEDNVSGLLVTPGVLEPLVEALARLAIDPALRLRLGQAGRARVLADYDVHTNARALRDIFNSYLGPSAVAGSLR